MRTRVLLLTAALVMLLGFPAVAEETAEVQLKAPEVTVETPQAEAGQASAAAEEPAANEPWDLGLETILDQPVEMATCPICPLTFCEKAGRRCDYTGCNRRCCSYNCYDDASCAAGACYTYACHCRFVEL